MVEIDRKCSLCPKVCAMGKLSFASHVLGKKHRRNVKTTKTNAIMQKRRLMIYGSLPLQKEVNKIVEEFWSYKLENVVVHPKGCYIDLQTKEDAAKAMKDEHYIKGIKLTLSFATVFSQRHLPHFKASRSTSDLPPISSRTMDRVQNCKFSGQPLEDLIRELVHELELKPHEYKQREVVRLNVQKFLRTLFPMTRTHVFGSSGNNLGFSRCDVDMVADFGFDVWANKSKEEGENDAALLTKRLARQIWNKKLGYQVVPIARARVPIIKFWEIGTRIEVDLSFKNGMPIYNTALIKLYTTIHPLVRPYMMIIRAWAKRQELAGGGKPSVLVTNYCLAMMMIFWLMIRSDKIVPCVGELQEMHMMRFPPVLVNGWNCSFSENVTKWKNLRHSAYVIDLIMEFFEFYGQLDTKEYVVSPLAGALIKRVDMKTLNPRCAPRYLQDFFTFKLSLELDTPLCIQDPFEQSHNISRGLHQENLDYFQKKCREAFVICKKIKKGEAPLGDIFEDTDLDDDSNEEDMPPLEEPSTSGISGNWEVLSVCSDNSVEVLEEEEKNDSLHAPCNSSDEGKAVTTAVKDREESPLIENKVKQDENVTNDVTTSEVIDLKEDSIFSVTDSSSSVIELKEDSNLSQPLSTAFAEDDVTIVEELSLQNKENIEVVELENSINIPKTSSNSEIEMYDPLERDSCGTVVLVDDLEEPDITECPTDESKANLQGLKTTMNSRTIVKERFKFSFVFGSCYPFEFLQGGKIKKIGSELLEGSAKHKYINGFWTTFLSCCLKEDIDEIQGPSVSLCENGKANDDHKRKNSDSGEESPDKYIKLNDGHGEGISPDFILISKHKVKNNYRIWEGRKKHSKNMFPYFPFALESEIALSDLVAQHSKLPYEVNFETSLWNDPKYPNMYWVTLRPEPLLGKRETSFLPLFDLMKLLCTKCSMWCHSQVK